MSEDHLSLISNPDPVMYINAAGEYLGLHPRTLHKWVQKKKFLELLKPIRLGNRLGFRVSALEEFLKARTIAPPAGRE